jgi:hypothetical protein
MRPAGKGKTRFSHICLSSYAQTLNAGGQDLKDVLFGRICIRLYAHTGQGRAGAAFVMTFVQVSMHS